MARQDHRVRRTGAQREGDRAAAEDRRGARTRTHERVPPATRARGENRGLVRSRTKGARG